MRRPTPLIAGAIALGLAVIIGVSIFVIMPALNPAPQSVATSSPTATHHPKKVHHRTSPTMVLNHYAPQIRDSFAQYLHLTREQLKTDLQSGKTLSDVATAQGISADQLTTIVHDAFTTGLQPAVTAKKLDQSQVDDLIKKYQGNQKSLEIFLGAGKKAA